jgi:RNA polymerase sigma-70 factor (ECF subfamily)
LKDWDDDRGWRKFFDTFWRFIYRVALKAGLNEAEAQDVVQDVVLSVAKQKMDFCYDPEPGSFKGWLLQLTGWRISKQLARRGRGQSSSSPAENAESQTPTVERVPDPQSLRDLERLRNQEREDNLLQTDARGDACSKPGRQR